MTKKKTIILALVGVLLTAIFAGTLTAALAGANGDRKFLPPNLCGDPTASQDIDLGTLAPTANESGWLSLKIWEDKLHAFRTCRKSEEAADHWRVAFAEDNTMMLWAMSKGTYAYSHVKGYGAALRDFILGCIRNEAAGKFYMGKFSGVNDSKFELTTVDRPDGLPFVFEDPYVPFMPLWGVASYTMAYPAQDGEQTAAYYRNYVGMLLERQQHIIDMGVETEYLTTSSLSFHMATAANWYNFTGETKYLSGAKSTFSLIKKRLNKDRTFREDENGGTNPLRHIQTVWAMFETLRAVGDFNGLRTTMESARAMMKPSKKGAGIYLTNNFRESATDDANCTALQIAYGYYYLTSVSADSAQAKHGYETTLGNRANIGTQESPAYVYDTWVDSDEEGLAHSGTLEGNSMAWLVEWWNQVLATGGSK